MAAALRCGLAALPCAGASQKGGFLGTAFEAGVWELYQLDQDFSECLDLALANPEKPAPINFKNKKHSELSIPDEGKWQFLSLKLPVGS